jgi:radical SAM protein with 4Fe4S-binding SPASM domain
MATHSSSGHGGRALAESDAFLAEYGYLRRPDFVQWMATLRCELSCPHCLAAETGTADMPLRDVQSLLDQVAELGVRGFLVTGGEPAARPDLPEVIAALGERAQSWQINTAAMPAPPLRAAMERHPPDFAAVSLDGPEEVHDRFRGRSGAHRAALEAIRFYRGIVDGDVVAGTTVTARNYPHLSSTFEEVLRSGATAWGLHLLVPEGRAAADRSLFLSRRQLRGLIDFCAARRADFPVGMADEIGWLGADEERVRDMPFFCGAGRTQCVVLPDGEVVPCTTLDRSTSAGNVLRSPLAEIWERGFAQIRNWRPEGRCADCEYARACRGGCWLQRRNGTQCFKGVWRAPRLAAAAAGAAVCLGLATSASAGEPRIPPKMSDIPVKKAEAESGQDAISDIPLGGVFPLKAVLVKTKHRVWLDQQILEWHAWRAAGRAHIKLEEIRKAYGAKTPEDPGTRYLLKVMEDKRAGDIAGRCRDVLAATQTKTPSLSLIVLLWRDLVELSLDGKPSEKRTPQERRALREALSILSARTDEWRPLLLKKKFEWGTNQIGVGGGGMAGVFGYKGGGGRRRYVYSFSYCRRLLEGRRWPKLEGSSKLPDDYTTKHPFGEHLSLSVKCAAGKAEALRLVRPGEKPQRAAKLEMRIFDLLKTPKGSQVKVVVFDGSDSLAVVLPGGCEISYGDLLRLCREQNRAAFTASAWKLSKRGYRAQPRPLLLPELRVMAGYAGDPTPANLAEPIAEHIRKLGSNSWTEREAASKALTAIGRPALPALRRALKHQDAEVAARAEWLLEEICRLKNNLRVIEARAQVLNIWMF